MSYLQTESGIEHDLGVAPIELYRDNGYKKYGEAPSMTEETISGIVKLNGFCVLKDEITVSSLFCFKSFFNHS